MIRFKLLLQWVKGDTSLPAAQQMYNLALFVVGILSIGTVFANLILGFIDRMLAFSVVCVCLAFALWGLNRWTSTPIVIVPSLFSVALYLLYLLFVLLLLLLLLLALPV